MLRVRAVREVGLAMLAAMFMVACVNSPIKVAQTVEQKAYATYGTFVIAEEQAVKLTAPTSSLTPNAKLTVINAMQKAQPAVDTMMKGFNQYQVARADFEAQKIGQPAFQVVVDNLGKWVSDAEPLVTSLQSAVRGAK